MKPPRIAEWLLRRAAGSEDRAEILAELVEEAEARAIEHGDIDARRWYRAQVRQSLGPLLWRRLTRHSRMTPHNAGNRPGLGLLADLRYAQRSLRKSPGFAIAVILILAVGIGAITVAYAVVDGMLLRPLPFGGRGDRLVTVHSTHPTQATDWNDSEISYPDLMDLRREMALEGLEGFIGRNLSLSDGQVTERVLGASITTGLFSMLGVAPAQGRDFTETDGADIGFETTAILSHALWRSLLGGASDVIGRKVYLNSRAITVIGVMPEGFSFPEGQRLWLPYRGHLTERRAFRGVLGVGLLKSETTIGQAAAALEAAATRLAATYPTTNRDWGVYIQPLRKFFVAGSLATTLLVAVSLVLLVACANVAGLIAARGLRRQPELSLRAAIGAGRWRLVRLLAAETTLLVSAGGAIGLAFASSGLRAWLAFVPELPPYWAQPILDVRVAMFVCAVTGVVALAAGVLPAIRIARVDSGDALRGARAAGGTRQHRRMHRTLIVSQLGVSLALMVAALLLSRSAMALLTADGGFDMRPLFSLRFYIAGDRYDPVAARAAAVDEVVRRVGAVPGVRAVGATGSIPTDDGGATVRIVSPADVTQREIGAQLVPATPTFWQALNLSPIDGRSFTTGESTDPETDAVIINQRLARQFFDRESAIGGSFRLTDPNASRMVRVVGVVPDLVYEEFGEETPQSQLVIYVPNARAGWRTQALLIRVDGDPAAIEPGARAAVRAVDPGFAVFDAMTMTARRAYNHWANRFLAQTFSAFAVVTLLLACIGTYGLAAYGVAQRRREIGVRLAMGANRGSILTLFLSGAGRLAIAGVVLGVPLALVLSRVLQSLLFRVSTWTPEIWIGVPALLAVSVLIASYFPARSATKLDPTTALKGE